MQALRGKDLSAFELHSLENAVCIDDGQIRGLSYGFTT